MLLGSLDGRLAVWVATHRYAPLNQVFVWLGTVEKLGAVWIVLALLAALVTRRRAAETIGIVLLTALATFTADAISFGIKDLVHRTRPFVAHPEIDPLYSVHSSSFPAGHAATAFAAATLLSYAFRRGLPLFLLVAAAIAFSRVYVGVHYPGDVLGGAALGVAVGAAAAAVLALVHRHRASISSLVSRRTRLVERPG
jgi:undecaprenyl-diphosphatase